MCESVTEFVGRGEEKKGSTSGEKRGRECCHISLCSASNSNVR